MIRTIGFDGDDTLWENENLFAEAQEKFRRMLSQYHEAAWIDRKLLNPTAENMARVLLHDVCPKVLDGTGVRVMKVVLWETENCFAEVESHVR